MITINAMSPTNILHHDIKPKYFVAENNEYETVVQIFPDMSIKQELRLYYPKIFIIIVRTEMEDKYALRL